GGRGGVTVGTGWAAPSGAERGVEWRWIPKWSGSGRSHQSPEPLEPKLLFTSCLLLSALEDDVLHGHFTWSQTSHEHFLDGVSWIETRSRSRCLRPARTSRPRRVKRRSCVA